MAGIRSEYQGKELAEGEKADVLGLSGLQTFPGLLQGLLCRPRGLQGAHSWFYHINRDLVQNSDTFIKSIYNFLFYQKDPNFQWQP